MFIKIATLLLLSVPTLSATNEQFLRSGQYFRGIEANFDGYVFKCTNTDSCKVNLEEIIHQFKTAVLENDQSEFENLTLLYYRAWKFISEECELSPYKKEIDYMLPLCDSDEKSDLLNAWDSSLSETGKTVVGLWKKWDFLPSTVENERLIEHFRRIMYVQQNFKKNDSSVYGTDERGFFYVKYGEPITRRVINTTVDEVTDPRTGQVYSFSKGSLIPIQVELWQYRFDGRRDRVSLFFGQNKDDSRDYAYYPNILDLIPWRSAQLSLNDIFIPQYKVRDLIYAAGLEKLGRLDGAFSELYLRLESDMMSIGGRAAFVDMVSNVLPQYSNNLVSTSKKDWREAPTSESKALKNVHTLKFSNKIYRMPTARGTRYLVYSFVDLRGGILEEKKRLQAISTKSINLKLIHTLTWFDKYSKFIDNINYITEHNEFNTNNMVSFIVSELDASYCFFEAVEVTNSDRLEIFEKQYNSPSDSTISSLVGVLRPQELILPNRIAKEALLVSDLMIGLPQEPDTSSPLSFTPELEPEFKQNQLIAIYFEVLNKNGVPYEVTYSLESGKKFALRRRAASSINLKFAGSEQKVEKRYVEVDLSAYPVGTYDLVLRFKSGELQIERREGLVITPR